MSMKELELFNEWTNSVMGKYANKPLKTQEQSDSKIQRVVEGYNDSVEELRAKLASLQKAGMKASAAKVAKELRQKLAQQKSSGVKASQGSQQLEGEINEGDEPYPGATFSPLSMTNREQPSIDPIVAAKKRREDRGLRRWMGHLD